MLHGGNTVIEFLGCPERMGFSAELSPPPPPKSYEPGGGHGFSGSSDRLAVVEMEVAWGGGGDHGASIGMSGEVLLHKQHDKLFGGEFVKEIHFRGSSLNGFLWYSRLPQRQVLLQHCPGLDALIFVLSAFSQFAIFPKMSLNLEARVEEW